MARFYRKSWFPYVTPFLVYLTLSEAVKYLPVWVPHLYLVRTVLCGYLLWLWRHKFHGDYAPVMTNSQRLFALGTGVLGFGMWMAAIHFQLISIPQQSYPEHWSLILNLAVCGISLLGFIVIFPLLLELFWRSFMLRYLIIQDFQTVALGSFQLFSFLLVIILTALPSDYYLVFAVIAALQNLLMIWQKNLRCCIVSHVVTNSLFAGYLLSNGRQLF